MLDGDYHDDGGHYDDQNDEEGDDDDEDKVEEYVDEAGFTSFAPTWTLASKMNDPQNIT